MEELHSVDGHDYASENGHGNYGQHDYRSDRDDRYSYASELNEAPVPPIKDRPVLGEVLAPRPQRDTIHNIVDTYRDSVITTSSEQDDSYDHYQEDESLPAMEEKTTIQAAGSVDDEDLTPPKLGGPVFDLTPGREPSPARYKHGEPLHFGKPMDVVFGNGVLMHSGRGPRRRGGVLKNVRKFRE
jgi:hypothetical protein